MEEGATPSQKPQPGSLHPSQLLSALENKRLSSWRSQSGEGGWKWGQVGNEDRVGGSTRERSQRHPPAGWAWGGKCVGPRIKSDGDA